MFKEMKGKQSMRYRGSRKGFARITDEILKKDGPCPKEKIRLRAWVRGYEKREAENTEEDELIKKTKEILRAPSSEGSPQSGVNGDALSQVVTQPERRGRLRGAGAGVSLSKSVLQAKYSAKIIGLEKAVESLKGNVDSLSTLVEKQAKLISSLMRNQDNHQQKQVEELDNEDEDNDEDNDEEFEESDQENLGSHSHKKNVKSNETPSTTPHSHNGSSSHLLKGKCKLFNWKNSQELVAMGKFSSEDPNEVVHGKPLGEGVSRVWVEMAYQPKAPLFRPCFGNEVIEDMIGSTTAWPTIDIMMID